MRLLSLFLCLYMFFHTSVSINTASAKHGEICATECETLSQESNTDEPSQTPLSGSDKKRTHCQSHCTSQVIHTSKDVSFQMTLIKIKSMHQYTFTYEHVHQDSLFRPPRT